MSSHRTCRICLDTKCTDIVTFTVEGSEWARLFEFCVGVSLASEGCSQQSCAFGRNCADRLCDFYEFKRKCLKNDAVWRQMCSKENEIEDENVKVKIEIVEDVYRQDSCVEQIINVSHSADSEHDIKQLMEESSILSNESTPGESSPDTKNLVSKIIGQGYPVKNESRDDSDTGNENFDNSPSSPQTENNNVKIEKEENTESEQDNDIYEEGDKIIIPRKYQHQLDAAEFGVTKREVTEIVGKVRDSDCISRNINKLDNISRKGTKGIIEYANSESVEETDNEPNSISKVSTQYADISKRRKKVIIPSKYKICSTENVDSKTNNEAIEKSNESNSIPRKRRKCDNTSRKGNRIIIPTKYKVNSANTEPEDNESNNFSRKVTTNKNISRKGEKGIIENTNSASEDETIINYNESNSISRNRNELESVSSKGRKVIIPKKYKACSAEYSDSESAEDSESAKKPDPDYNPGSEEDDDVLEYVPNTAAGRLKEILELRGGATNYRKKPQFPKPRENKVELPPAPFSYCGICTYRCSHMKDLKTHWNNHVAKITLNCKLCEYIGRDFADMAAHRILPSEKLSMKCHKHYKNEHMEFHYRSVHLRKKGGWCRLCGKEYAQYNTLKDHLDSHENQYICDCCGRKFSRASLISHLGPKIHVCDQCGKGFSSAYYLKCHLDTHSTTANLNLKCDHCDKTFRYKKQLRSHQYKLKENKNICEICGTVFRTKHSLQSHQKTHNDDMPFSCSICGKKFKWKANLKAHALRHEKGIVK